MNRHQIAMECVKIEKAGGSVLDFLRKQGCISPWGTWYRLQKEELERRESEISDGKGKEMKRVKMTDEQKAQAIKIAMAGGDPRNYLRDCGSQAPDIMWQKIRDKMRAEDPEAYAKLPARIPRAKKETPKTKVEIKEKLPAEAESVALVYDPSIREEYQREQNAKMKITEPLCYDGMEVRSVYVPGLGEFHYDKEYNNLEWTAMNGDGADFPPVFWKDLIRELPKVGRVLGIDLEAED